jgi:aminoglycoside phosphotransferase (APT) family kinase protein
MQGDQRLTAHGVEAAKGRWRVIGVFDFESAVPGDPVEDLLWTADHGLDSPDLYCVLIAAHEPEYASLLQQELAAQGGWGSWLMR